MRHWPGAILTIVALRINKTYLRMYYSHSNTLIYTDIHRMTNYFELLGLPESFLIKEDLLKQRLAELTTECEADSRDAILIQHAYKTLIDPMKRTGYILASHDLLNEGAKPQLPTDFLSQVMDLEERLMNVNDSDKLGKIAEETASIENNLNEDLQCLAADYEELNNTAKEDRLIKIAEIYYEQKYLLRIKESLNTFAARF